MIPARAADPRQPARFSLRLEPVDDAEFARVLRTGDAAPALESALTFLPPAKVSEAEWLQSWGDWQDGILARTLGPLLSGAASAAAQGQAREVLALDLELHSALEPDARERSAAAGRRLLQRLHGARGERWLGKLQTWASEGQFPAHFPTIYACQCAIFHLPLRLLLPGYAYWEWCAAMTARPPVGGGAPPPFDAAAPALRQMGETLLPSVSSDVVDFRPAFRAP